MFGASNALASLGERSGDLLGAPCINKTLLKGRRRAIRGGEQPVIQRHISAHNLKISLKIPRRRTSRHTANSHVLHNRLKISTMLSTLTICLPKTPTSQIHSLRSLPNNRTF